MKDGSRCPWGSDRSPEVSSPEQEPPPLARPRRNTLASSVIPSLAAAAAEAGANSSPPSESPVSPAAAAEAGANASPPTKSPVSPAAAAYVDESIGGGKCLPNLEPGGPCGIPTPPPRRPRIKDPQPEQSLDLTPVSSPLKSQVAVSPALHSPNPRPPTVWNRTLFAQHSTNSK